MEDQSEFFYDLDHLLTRPSEFAPEEFEPSPEVNS